MSDLKSFTFSHFPYLLDTTLLVHEVEGKISSVDSLTFRVVNVRMTAPQSIVPVEKVVLDVGMIDMADSSQSSTCWSRP